MAVAYESIATTTTTAGTTIEISKPSGAAAGDLLLALLGANTTSTWTELTNWTKPSDLDVQMSGIAHRICVQWLIVTGSEGSSFTFTAGGSVAKVGSILRISGADSTSPIHVYATSQQTTNDVITTPTVTTTIDECLIIRWGASYHGGTSNRSSTAMANFTERFDNDMANSTLNTGATGDALASIGATGTANFTLTASASDNSVGQTLAIAPLLATGIARGAQKFTSWPGEIEFRGFTGF